MATPEEAFQASLNDFARLNNDLARWLRTLGVEMRQLESARAQRTGVVADGASKASQALGDGLQNLMNAFNTYLGDEIDNATGGGGGVPPGWHRGTDTVNSGGADHPVNYSTGVTGETWVAANSVIIGWMPYQPYISDPASGFFFCGVKTITAGSGFDFAVKESFETGVSYSAVIYWVGFTP